MSKILIEACVTSAQSALNAEKGGALRVELCDNLIEGGTTPGTGTIAILRKRLKIGLFIMIRPRGGDFSYSDLNITNGSQTPTESERSSNWLTAKK